jgi:hypothetical protein
MSDWRLFPALGPPDRAVSIPLDGNGFARRVFIDGEGAEIANAPVAELNVVTSGFLATLGTPLLEGREFTPMDTAAAVEPVVVNDVLARRLLALRVGDREAPSPPIRERPSHGSDRRGARFHVSHAWGASAFRALAEPGPECALAIDDSRQDIGPRHRV